MPMTKDGTIRADCIMDPISVVSRMNIGRYYDIYLAGCSRKARSIIRNILLNWDDVSLAPEKECKEAWNHVRKFLSYFNTEQYSGYSQLTWKENERDIRNILQEVVDHELYVYYKITSERKPIEIVDDLMKTEYAAVKDQIWIDKDGTPT